MVRSAQATSSYGLPPRLGPRAPHPSQLQGTAFRRRAVGRGSQHARHPRRGASYWKSSTPTPPMRHCRPSTSSTYFPRNDWDSVGLCLLSTTDLSPDLSNRHTLRAQYHLPVSRAVRLGRYQHLHQVLVVGVVFLRSRHRNNYRRRPSPRLLRRVPPPDGCDAKFLNLLRIMQILCTTSSMNDMYGLNYYSFRPVIHNS